MTSFLRRSIPALFLAGGLFCAPPLTAEELSLTDLLEKHAGVLDELAKAVAAFTDSGEETAPRLQTSGREAGLRTSGLQTGTIQGATGLNSVGLGLTPIEQWRVLFPPKKQ